MFNYMYCVKAKHFIVKAVAICGAIAFYSVTLCNVTKYFIRHMHTDYYFNNTHQGHFNNNYKVVIFGGRVGESEGIHPTLSTVNLHRRLTFTTSNS